MPNDKGFFTFFILGARKRAAPIVCYNENSPFFPDFGGFNISGGVTHPTPR